MRERLASHEEYITSPVLRARANSLEPNPAHLRSTGQTLFQAPSRPT